MRQETRGVHGEARRHEGAVELHALQRPVGRAPAARLASFGSTTRSSRSASATTHPTRPLGAVPFQMACDGTRLAAGKKTAWSRAGFRQILNVTPLTLAPCSSDFQIDRLLGFTTLHDSRRYAIYLSIYLSRMERAAGGAGEKQGPRPATTLRGSTPAL